VGTVLFLVRCAGRVQNQHAACAKGAKLGCAALHPNLERKILEIFWNVSCASVLKHELVVLNECAIAPGYFAQLSRNHRLANVRFGSKADIRTLFRFCGLMRIVVRTHECFNLYLDMDIVPYQVFVGVQTKVGALDRGRCTKACRWFRVDRIDP